MRYPKVLLLGEPFNDYTGMGITLLNLFKDWPKENITIASYNLDVNLCEKLRPCAQYVVFGNINNRTSTHTPSKQSKGIKTILRDCIKYIYDKTGLADFRRIPITKSLLDCIESFQPDIIFSALGTLNRIRFCEEVMTYAPNSKLALYIVDDWPNTRFNGRLFKWFWRKKYDTAYRQIITRADTCLSICQYMSDSYKSQYGVVFHPFHNPVDIVKWDSIERKRKYKDNVFSVLYVGKINQDTQKTLQDLCKVVSSLNQKGENIVFDIYSPNTKHKINLTKYNGCNIKGQIPNEQIPMLMKGYDALFLTLGFSNTSRQYVRLSMPTKLTEYLVSGVPILLYCPEEIALSKYVSEHNAAVVCNKPDKKLLQSVLLNLIHNNDYNKDVVRCARELSQQHDIKVVRERFRNVLDAAI